MSYFKDVLWLTGVYHVSTFTFTSHPCSYSCLLASTICGTHRVCFCDFPCQSSSPKTSDSRNCIHRCTPSYRISFPVAVLDPPDNPPYSQESKIGKSTIATTTTAIKEERGFLREKLSNVSLCQSQQTLWAKCRLALSLTTPVPTHQLLKIQSFIPLLHHRPFIITKFSTSSSLAMSSRFLFTLFKTSLGQENMSS